MTIDTKRSATVAASALAAAAIAVTGMGPAPTANATCASFFGIGGGGNCTSTLTSIAIAVGQGAQAHADGMLGAAIGLGAGSFTNTSDAFNFALATGKVSRASARGVFGIASALGPFTTAQVDGRRDEPGSLGLNIALNFSPFNKKPYGAIASGVGNVALNLFGTSTGQFKSTAAVGVTGIGVNIGGRDNEIFSAGKFMDTAFNVLGNRNRVTAAVGPFALAGTILQSDAVVSKRKPGFNINGIRVPNTAAATGAEASESPAAAKRPSRAAASHRANARGPAAKPAATRG